MNCETISKLLISFVDGRASVKERSQVENHLPDCAACRAQVEQYRAVWNVLGEEAAIEPSFAFDARLRALPPRRGRSGLGGWCLRRVWLFPPRC